jgi:hypothetical protein
MKIDEETQKEGGNEAMQYFLATVSLMCFFGGLLYPPLLALGVVGFVLTFFVWWRKAKRSGHKERRGKVINRTKKE